MWWFAKWSSRGCVPNVLVGSPHAARGHGTANIAARVPTHRPHRAPVDRQPAVAVRSRLSNGGSSMPPPGCRAPPRKRRPPARGPPVGTTSALRLDASAVLPWWPTLGESIQRRGVHWHAGVGPRTSSRNLPGSGRISAPSLLRVAALVAAGRIGSPGHRRRCACRPAGAHRRAPGGRSATAPASASSPGPRVTAQENHPGSARPGGRTPGDVDDARRAASAPACRPSCTFPVLAPNCTRLHLLLAWNHLGRHQ